MHHLLASMALIIAGLFTGPMAMATESPQSYGDSEDEGEDTLLTEARDSLQRGNPAVAVTLLSRLTANRPADALAWSMLAEAHDVLGQSSEAAAARARA